MIFFRIKNESYETIKRYQRKAERLSNDYKKLLANKAEFKIRKGKNKAVPLNKNPRAETLQEIQYYNILGDYVNNMNKLESIAKRQVKVSFTSTTLNNLLKDLNYLQVPSLLETME